MYILGINIGHDATASLIKDGKIVAAIAEERISRIKYHFGFPYGAIKEVMYLANIKGEDIKYVVLAFNNDIKRSPFHYTDTIIDRSGSIDPSNEIDNRTKINTIKEIIYRKFLGEERYWNLASNYAENKIKTALNKLNITNAVLLSKDHHMGHAASAYYEGGKNKALIITMDGAGDGLCASASVGNNGNITRIAEVNDLYSLGRFYSAITKYLGFKRNRHEGKITGLAAFGNPDKLYDLFKQLINLTEDKKGFYSPLAGSMKGDALRWRELGNFLKGTYYGHNFTNLYINFLREHCINESKEDIAAAAQKLTEDLIVEFIKLFIEETQIYDIVMAGGLFANVKVNQRVLEIDGVKSVFIHPNMGDGGTATGAAYLVYKDIMDEQGKFFTPFTIENVYYGPSYNDNEILEALKKYDNIKYRKSENVIDETAEMIFQKKVVGWFQGRMEYGPRALGNRSILIDPTDRSINDSINKRLKRTEFMPFAPSCLIDNAHEIFKKYNDGEYPSYFMTITFDVEKEWTDKIQAVNHVDNTARPQVVKENQNPMYYAVLKKYRELKGIPLFVNTSFNMHEEPIVCTPDDAIRSLIKDCVDVLVIGNYIVEIK